nr:hypothetical protein L204_02847 [Cryptococcus depauperatus CBS 7855]
MAKEKGEKGKKEEDEWDSDEETEVSEDEDEPKSKKNSKSKSGKKKDKWDSDVETEVGEDEEMGVKYESRSLKKPKPKTPYEYATSTLSSGDCFIYIISLVLLIPTLTLLALIMAIPFAFCRRTRPRLLEGFKRDPYHRRKRRGTDYEWYGPGKELPLGLAFAPLGRGEGLHWRLWEIYGYFRQVCYMILKQGLQVGGVLSGLIILTWQILMMLHDFRDKNIVEYQVTSATETGDHSSLMKQDDKCAYATGTGIANWAGGTEPLAWYGCYHGFLCLLCVFLVVDELFNVRFGCFAPQWYRSGIGYTIIFLVSATLSTSPNWGATKFIQLYYITAVVILVFGIYNVLRTMVASNRIAHESYTHTDYRVGRKPLRLWTESEWTDMYFRRNFLPGEYRRYGWTERVQFKLGDHAFPLERRPQKDIDKERARLLTEKKEIHKVKELKIQKVLQRSPEELILMRGTISKNAFRGGPIKLHDLSVLYEDIRARARIHIADIDPENPPTKEEQKKMIEAWNEDKGYFGLANWKPKTRRFSVWFWFDIRRFLAILLAAALFIIRLGSDLSFSKRPAYSAQYEQAVSDWSATHTGGPDASKCQYYHGSSVPIFVITGQDKYNGVIANMVWVAIWHSFLLGMCLAIISVSLSNNMWWGMHWPFPPITLIGPRMTSLSTGLTLGFVAFATLQQGFFFENE